MIGSFEGFRVFAVEHMTKAGYPVKVKRSLVERLLSLPWRPLRTHRTVVPQVPSDEVIVDRDRMAIYMHPARWRQIQAELDKHTESGAGEG